MSKVFKKVKRVVKKVVSGVVSVVKSIAKSPIFKTIAIAAAVYFTGGAALGAIGGISSGAGMLSGAMSGISSAWAGLSGAGSALMSGNLTGAAKSLSGGWAGAASKGAGLLTQSAMKGGATSLPPASSLDQFMANNNATDYLKSAAPNQNLPGLPGGAPWAGQGAASVPMPGGTAIKTGETAKAGLLSSVAPYAVYAAGQGLSGMAQQKAEEEAADESRARYNKNMGAELWTDKPSAGPRQYGATPNFNSRF